MIEWFRNTFANNTEKKDQLIHTLPHTIQYIYT